MSEFFDPYNADRPLMLKCSCGRDHSPADHHAEVAADAAAATLRARSETAEFEAYSQEFIEATLVKALFPQDQERRNFLRADQMWFAQQSCKTKKARTKSRRALKNVQLKRLLCKKPPCANREGPRGPPPFG